MEEVKRRRGNPGRPYKTKVVSFRVRLEWIAELTELIRNFLNSKQNDSSGKTSGN
jgi:hypothetical protein